MWRAGRADVSKEEAFEIASWQMQEETLPSLKGSWQDCPKAGVEEAGEWVSCLVTQCFVVKTKGHEVRVVGKQDRENNNNCTQHILQGSRSVVHINSWSSWHPHPERQREGWLYYFSFSDGHLEMLGEVSLPEWPREESKKMRAPRFSHLWC